MFVNFSTDLAWITPCIFTCHNQNIIDMHTLAVRDGRGRRQPWMAQKSSSRSSRECNDHFTFIIWLEEVIAKQSFVYICIYIRYVCREKDFELIAKDAIATEVNIEISFCGGRYICIYVYVNKVGNDRPIFNGRWRFDIVDDEQWALIWFEWVRSERIWIWFGFYRITKIKELAAQYLYTYIQTLCNCLECIFRYRLDANSKMNSAPYNYNVEAISRFKSFFIVRVWFAYGFIPNWYSVENNKFIDSPLIDHSLTYKHAVEDHIFTFLGQRLCHLMHTLHNRWTVIAHL